MRPDINHGKQHIPDETREPSVLALMALAWTLADDRRADRLLALTGLDADTLRNGVGDPAILSAVLGFLADHEPDLIACAESIDSRPEALIAARESLIA
ncbi:MULTISPECIES: DUF3572 domain-containing protein [Sphingobium]|jgi:hypothetical protein|uniref:DUF3572 domain-containing protein n=2 Tax=Sphingobium fuliginis (strain ATCC 27551) TaxID=336203 RepID=A0A292ZL04_SPHSA|nr:MULTISPECIES: DUF3572 domain-containing protein [Sphingobium]OAP33009.1 hypothetical protein A8O16_03735 [Sphingobium sp. 20006FA]AJR23998.1 hypothetical protein TZ53_09995 [Sphingobium sp. YBL2]KXU33179.1 hypothetical protein AXW74_02870 [Sphingobium sp. AM]KYC32008.1 hypothetical protein A0J57_11680 [Sphingobium sp. 22B]MCB4862900.1 DUF3572 domain-containing protein [Sphingobium sp. PNB]